MIAEKEFERVTREILEKITPSPNDRERKEALAKALELKVMAACKEFGINAVVRVEGSFAKDTWLKEDPDIDVFMRLPTSIPHVTLGEVALKVAKKATEGSKQVERFAEHPFLEAFVDETRVNIVPCYDTMPGEWLSATDRTPYHTDYINKCLDKALLGDVRLLKRFMKGIGVYGAEIKIGGFSGYLCELLVLHYGSFLKVLEAFADYNPKLIIDIESHYKQRLHDIDLLFPEILVIVDPVDKGRNVASAVQPRRLHIFVAACRAFIRKPNTEFFYPLITNSLSAEELQTTLKNRGSALIFLTLGKVEAVPDVLWGQLHRTLKALRKQLQLCDFKVLRDDVWNEDSAGISVFIFELEQQVLPSAKKHLGPPLEFRKECERFLAKYTSRDSVLAGPFIDNGRWVVEIPRKFSDAAKLLAAKVEGGGRNAGVAGIIAKSDSENFLILVGDEITEHYVYNEDFAVFLTAFLSGKPSWLEMDN
jgi:tRNA nucleotidyltransferase (CCA-adding enzyme)